MNIKTDKLYKIYIHTALRKDKCSKCEHGGEDDNVLLLGFDTVQTRR
jgi:hypothetical protein